VEQSDALAADLICPSCGTCSITLTEGVEPPLSGQADGHAAAACGHCGRQFHSDVLPTYARSYEELTASAAAEPCPLCRSGRRRVQALCDRIAKQCFFVVSCEECGDVRFP
jgi:hypothetical protein